MGALQRHISEDVYLNLTHINYILTISLSLAATFYLSKPQQGTARETFYINHILYSCCCFFSIKNNKLKLKSAHFPYSDTEMPCWDWIQLIGMAVILMLVTVNHMLHISALQVSPQQHCDNWNCSSLNGTWLKTYKQVSVSYLWKLVKFTDIMILNIKYEHKFKVSADSSFWILGEIENNHTKEEM